MKKILACLALSALMVSGLQGVAAAKNYNTVSNLVSTQVQGIMMQKVFDDIERVTEGRVKLIWHDPGDLVPVAMHINAVSDGSVPAAFTAFAYFGGTIPLVNIFSGFPFDPGFDAWYEWLFHGDGLPILQETLDPLNIVALPMMATPRETGGYFNKEIKTVDDLKGLRFRVGGWGAEVVAKLGVAVSQIPATELYMAMDRGRIDALEFGNPAINNSFGFEKLARYCYFPGWHQPTGMEWLLVNKEVWASWSEADRAAILEICRITYAQTYYELKQLDIAAVDAIKDVTEIRRFPDEVLEALYQSWLQVYAEGAARYPEIKKAYESFMESAERTSSLGGLQELSDYSR